MSNIEYKKCPNEFIFKGIIFNQYSTPERLEETCKFEFLPNDIVVSTFARSGTTFTQEIIWQIKNRKKVVKGEKVLSTMDRFPFIEFNIALLPHFTKTFFEILNSQKNDPYRLIKTHVPFEFIKDNFEKVNPKMVIVMRNAKDCLVSMFHHYQFYMIDWHGTFEEFFPIFLHGKTFAGSYFDNNLTWWSLKDRDNVLLLFYEELVTNLPQNVVKIANFLGDELTQEEIDLISYNCSFETMRSNPFINYEDGDYRFVRKGAIGDWKNYLTEEQNRLLEEEIEKKFKGSGLTFVYE